jgi:hypothetical protein
MSGWQEGGCACGAVRYALLSPPMFTHCCHCTDCQTETGSAFVLNALIEGDRLVVTRGEAVPVMTPSASGKGQEIWRCPACHVALWSHYPTRRRKVAFVRVGTLDTPAACPPDVHIFTRSRLPWIALGDAAPAFPVYYDPDALWPAESLARRAVLDG